MRDSPEGIRIITPGARRGRKPGTTNKTRGKKSVDYSDIIFPLGIALDFLFSIPVQLKLGKHWELTDEENKDLAENIKDVLEAFPSDTTTEFIKALEKYIPLLTLGINLYGLVSVRLRKTKELADEIKRTEKERIANPFDGANREAIG